MKFENNDSMKSLVINWLRERGLRPTEAEIVYDRTMGFKHIEIAKKRGTTRQNISNQVSMAGKKLDMSTVPVCNRCEHFTTCESAAIKPMIKAVVCDNYKGER